MVRTAVAVALILTAVASGCSGVTAPGTPAELRVVAGDNQIRFPLSTLVDVLLVQVFDHAGNELTGVSVTWSVLDGGGSLSPTTLTTDSFGLARARWTLGPSVDVNVAEAIVAGLPPVTFTARAVPPGPIAFRSNRHAEAGGFGYDIFVMNEDGTDPVQLTTDPADEFDAAWSPDGSRLAFGREYDGYRSNHWEIVVINADGSGETRLTNTPTSQINLGPSWSPNGQRIAFASLGGPDGRADIFVMNADGSGRTNLTHQAGIDQDPAWSPDGRRIAFMRDLGGPGTRDFEIFVVNVDRAGMTRLTDLPGAARQPDWSPDGTKILFQYDDETCDGVWLMNADGTGVQPVRNCATHPSFGPDGKRVLASMVGVSDERDVFVIDLDTGEIRNLTNHPAHDGYPAWRR